MATKLNSTTVKMLSEIVDLIENEYATSVEFICIEDDSVEGDTIRIKLD